MDEVVSIAPVAGEPGLTAYECPKCGYVTSVLQQPFGARNVTENAGEPAVTSATSSISQGPQAKLTVAAGTR